MVSGETSGLVYGNGQTHVAKVLHVLDKVPLRKDQLVDGLLPLPLLRVNAVQHGLADTVGPQRSPASVLSLVLLERLGRRDLAQARLGLHVELLGLLNPERTRDRVAQRSRRARGRVAHREEGEDSRGQVVRLLRGLLLLKLELRLVDRSRRRRQRAGRSPAAGRKGRDGGPLVLARSED